MVLPCSTAAPTGIFSLKGKSHNSKQQSAPNLNTFLFFFQMHIDGECHCFPHCLSSVLSFKNIPFLNYSLLQIKNGQSCKVSPSPCLKTMLCCSNFVARLVFQRKQEKWYFQNSCVAWLLILSTTLQFTLRLSKSDNTASQASQQQTVHWSQLFFFLLELTAGRKLRKYHNSFIHSLIH